MTHPMNTAAPTPTAPTTLIAEDEPLLARGMVRLLAKLWPPLQVVATVTDGPRAIQACAEHCPDVVFLDVRMPGCTGIEAAEAIVDNWPEHKPLPLIVFVTAFDRYAVDAFERAAVDYVLKPVEPERMALTCERLRQRLSERAGGTHRPWIEGSVTQLAAASTPDSPLQWIPASVGETTHMVAIDDVLYLEADDKLLRVVTADKTYLVRMPLRELLPRLESGRFMQINRGIAVQAKLMDRVVRDELGRLQLCLRGRPERLAISRSHAHLFKAW
jgi:DNA-binding LytR/AlgR family response regulator